MIIWLSTIYYPMKRKDVEKPPRALQAILALIKQYLGTVKDDAQIYVWLG